MARPKKIKTGFVVNLNQSLIDKQNLSEAQILRIKAVHLEKKEIFDQMTNTDDPKKLKRLAKKVRDLEFSLQRLWGFELNPKMHDWFLVPKCLCPKQDNRERKGHGSIIDEDCPIHGKKI